MIKIRKYLQTMPVIIIWLLAFLFFADAANLDDFYPNVTIIHTDEPTENITDEGPEAILTQDYDLSLCNSPNNESLLKSIRVLFDQDSPSLAPDFEYVRKHNSEYKDDKKLILISVSLSKIFYIEYHSLLI